MSLKDKLIKNSTIKLTSTLTDSKVYAKKDMIPTKIPMINVALSSSFEGGMTPGLTTLAGPSKHFKTGFSLLLAKAFLDKYEDGVILFYDSEFGTPETYFKSFDISLDSVIHTPITDIEELKNDIMKQLKDLKREDHLMIVVDSLGNLASKKEVEDAVGGKSVADMTRAKSMKSLFRMVTPHLTLKDIPMVVINHTYKEMSLYPKDIVSGGTGAYYSSDTVWIIGRRQDKKPDKEMTGYHFIINIEKSRFLKEGSSIPITLSFEGGINKWSGLFDLAMEGNYIVQSKQGWYAVVDRASGELKEPNMRAADIIDNDDFWNDLLKTTDLRNYIEDKYKISHLKMLDYDEEEDIE